MEKFGSSFRQRRVKASRLITAAILENERRASGPVFARIAGLGQLLWLMLSPAAFGASATLAWNPSPSGNAAGYELFYGTNSGSHADSMDVGENFYAIVNGLAPGLTYYFAVAAYDDGGNESALSNIATLTMADAPAISNEPVSLVATNGGAATFSVDVNGDSLITYQWFDGLTPIAGATNAILTLSNISGENVGSYSVVASDAGGSVTSSVVTLAVVAPPVIISQPASLSAAPGWEATVAVGAAGSPPLSYQWYENGAMLDMETNSILTITNVTSASAGSYSVVIQNAVGGRHQQQGGVASRPGGGLAGRNLQRAVLPNQSRWPACSK